ncbi:MAG: type II secretion system protein [Elusimicrobiaceae bacterium]|nr:type II secretion system protein [Elusimicrobiaceae bacterium]
MKKQGFSLLEILVAILVIGILASLLLPMYNKMMERSHASEGIILLRRLYDSQKNYQIARGSFADSFKDLDFEFEGKKVTCKQSNKSDCWGYYNTEGIQGNRWSVELEKGDNPSISVGLIGGPYAGAGFFIQLERKSGVQYPLEKIACVENAKGRFTYKGEKDSYCVGVIGGKLYPKAPGTTSRKYTMPLQDI